MTPGEWTGADSATFAVALPEADSSGPTMPATLYVMNDDSVLYLALRLQRSSFGGFTQLMVDFDNDHDGARDDGDDLVSALVGEYSPVEFFDVYHLTCEGWPPNTAACSGFDPSVDGTAGAGVDSGFVVLEIAHPLNSADDAHDFSLSSGQTVGFDALVHLYSLDPGCLLGNACVADTWFPTGNPDGSEFGDIVIADSTGGGGDSAVTTTLTIEKTAVGFGEHELRYSWWIGKQVSPPVDTILLGQTSTLSYTIAIVRWPGAETVSYEIRGQLCVSNTGSVATDSLILLDHVQYQAAGDTAYQDVSGSVISGFPGHVQLGPKTTSCFDYDVRFNAVPGAAYRNVAQALINNYDGHLGEFFGPETIAAFSLPDSIPLVVYDTTAVVGDYIWPCPVGFTCTPSDWGPWYVAGDDTLRFTGQVRNDSAPCGAFTAVVDSAYLAASEGTWLMAGASVAVFTGDCSGGCTRTVGFWKTHTEFTGGNADWISRLLPIWLGTPGDSLAGDSLGPPSESHAILVTSAAQAAAILGMSLGSPSNGITKLYAQLLAAKLNVAAGASPSAVAPVIAAADEFLSTHDASSWDALTNSQRRTVLGWMSLLERYNTGEIGPGPCP